MKGIYITCSPICSECGTFLQPELVRNANDVATGELKVRGHAVRCSLFGTVASVRLPLLPIVDPIPEKAAA